MKKSTEIVASIVALGSLAGTFPVFGSVQFGNLTIGGAMPVNYQVGDYAQPVDHSATRGGSGNFALDTFRINLDYERDQWIAKGEYRIYPGYAAKNADSYHFPHTAWVGYNFDSGDQLQVGLNQAPFGPGLTAFPKAGSLISTIMSVSPIRCWLESNTPQSSWNQDAPASARLWERLKLNHNQIRL